MKTHKFLFIITFAFSFFTLNSGSYASDICTQRASSHTTISIDLDKDLKVLDTKIGVSVPETNYFYMRQLHYLNPMKSILDKARRWMPESFSSLRRVHFFLFSEQNERTYSNYAAIYCSRHGHPREFNIFVSSRFFRNTLIFRRFFTHELFHWISHQQEKDFPYWMEEGLAQIFESYLLEIPLYKQYMVEHLTNSPWLPLDINIERIANNRDLITSYYGHALLFLSYLSKDQTPTFLQHLMNSPEKNFKKVIENTYSKTHGKKISFRNLFVNFSLAKYINTIDYSKRDKIESEKYLVLPKAPATNLSTAPRGWNDALSAQILPSGAHAPNVIFIPRSRDHLLSGSTPSQNFFKGAIPLKINP